MNRTQVGCQHAMPYGAQVLPDGRVRFRLWAPQAKQVTLWLDNQPAGELAPQDNGWFELISDQARAGSRYQFQTDGDLRMPDPASRHQPEDVHGPSEVIDPLSFDWGEDDGWRGRPWEEAVIYELHVGAFTPEGTFKAAQEKLDYLADLGVTAIELMPVADFPGTRNWGYDGVLQFAPDSRYGRPEDLKAFIRAAHEKGLMVFLDVVYNHFGPEGNYLHVYAKSFFNEAHQTPWGAAINFDGPGNRPVRDFFIHNVLYWLEEFRFDGLRFDAVHAIVDGSPTHILMEIAGAVRAHKPLQDRRIHLILENDDNDTRFLQSSENAAHYGAQWNDDYHHAAHVLLSGERFGYYEDYHRATAPRTTLDYLGRCLAEGFAYQGEPSRFREDNHRGEVSKHLRPTAFVHFLQNHDQIGNRAFGNRLTCLCDPAALRAMAAVTLLAPGIPLLFMGEEWRAETPFLFFCDLDENLAPSVTEGRRQEFAKFPEFADPARQAEIPDPLRETTFAQSRLRWQDLARPAHRDWLQFTRKLLALRQARIVPLIPNIDGHGGQYEVYGDQLLHVRWRVGDGRQQLRLLANLSETSVSRPDSLSVSGTDEILFESEPGLVAEWSTDRQLPPWTVLWSCG